MRIWVGLLEAGIACQSTDTSELPIIPLLPRPKLCPGVGFQINHISHSDQTSDTVEPAQSKHHRDQPANPPTYQAFHNPSHYWLPHVNNFLYCRAEYNPLALLVHLWVKWNRNDQMYLPGDQQNQKRNLSGDRLDPSGLEEEGQLLCREKVWRSKAHKVEILVSSRSVSCWRCLDQSYFTDIKPSDQHNENINKNSRKKSSARIYYWNNRKVKLLHNRTKYLGTVLISVSETLVHLEGYLKGWRPWLRAAPGKEAEHWRLLRTGQTLTFLS